MAPAAIKSATGPAALWRFDEVISSVALLFMALIPLVEILSRPFMGKGIENSAVVVQHLGLVLSMFGAVAAERYGHLTTLGLASGSAATGRVTQTLRAVANCSAALICGVLAFCTGCFVVTEMQAGQHLAYGVPVWWVQAAMPLGYALLGAKLAARGFSANWQKIACGILLPSVGIALAHRFDGSTLLF